MVTPVVPKRPKQGTNAILASFLVTMAIGAVWFFTSSSTSSPPQTGGDIASDGRSPSKISGVGSLSASGGDNDVSFSASEMLDSSHPYILYGTAWKKDQTSSLVQQAIHAGFRFIDTACQPKHYNEAGVGIGWTTAASELNLSRPDFFLQTKFTALNGQDANNVPYDKGAPLEDQVRQSISKSLENLQTDYIDSLLLHSPMSTVEETITVWKVFEEFVDEGKVRRLGMSNIYDLNQFRLMLLQMRIKPWAIQNRFYRDSRFDIKIRGFCLSMNIKYQSFWTLTANKRALNKEEWIAMAQEKGLTPQTLMYAFMMSMGHTPLSGTKSLVHMEQDVDVMRRFYSGEEILSEEDVALLKPLIGMTK